jgi:hypothetical protein
MEARLELYTALPAAFDAGGFGGAGGRLQFGGTVMDLDYLLRRQQEEQMRAKSATCEQARAVHEALAAQFQTRIRLHGAVPMPVGSPAER